MSQVPQPSRPTLLAAATTLCLIAGGCSNGDVSAPQKLSFPAPVWPIEDPEVATHWYFRWVDEPDRAADGKVRGIQVFMTMQGRDWRGSEEPDGYALRVSLFGGLERYVLAKGSIKAFVVQEPGSPASRALHAWEIPAEDAERRIWGFPDGYILQLDWGGRPPPGAGVYMLVVRWESADGEHRVTGNYVFKDFLTGETLQTRTRPLR